MMPAWLVEMIHEFATPGGCWVSNKVVKNFHDPRNGCEAARVTLPGAAAMVLSVHAAERGKDGMTVTLTGLTHRGRDIGDWQVTVKMTRGGSKKANGDAAQNPARVQRFDSEEPGE